MGNCIGLIYALQYFQFIECPICKKSFNVHSNNIEKKKILKDGCYNCRQNNNKNIK